MRDSTKLSWSTDWNHFFWFELSFPKIFLIFAPKNLTRVNQIAILSSCWIAITNSVVSCNMHIWSMWFSVGILPCCIIHAVSDRMMATDRYFFKPRFPSRKHCIVTRDRDGGNIAFFGSQKWKLWNVALSDDAWLLAGVVRMGGVRGKRPCKTRVACG